MDQESQSIWTFSAKSDDLRLIPELTLWKERINPQLYHPLTLFSLLWFVTNHTQKTLNKGSKMKNGRKTQFPNAAWLAHMYFL